MVGTGRSCVTSKHRVQKDTLAGPQGGGQLVRHSWTTRKLMQWEFTEAVGLAGEAGGPDESRVLGYSGNPRPGQGRWNPVRHSWCNGPTDSQAGPRSCETPVRHSGAISRSVAVTVNKHGFESGPKAKSQWAGRVRSAGICRHGPW